MDCQDYFPKDARLWRFWFPECDYMSLGELLKEYWGTPLPKFYYRKVDAVVLLVHPPFKSRYG